ncbi:MAG: hypothetical protein JHC35_04550 [Sulfuricurvum sp.]|jgi:hypothetical protein|uniref:hypothetical protein n=1 Tax=Sulfuricurvum sp. TaxID=2025608 RepID=UPI0025FF6CB1|nr:hypothetical protein [Sulfuricurvum sp.]MCI4406544.1 hypothetical protein [Sulfuricurvum sp.]
MDNKIDTKISTLISDTARESAKAYQTTNLKARRDKEEDFLNQTIDYRDIILVPERYEGIVIALYLLIIPYLSGLLFLYLFIARMSYEYFLNFTLSSVAVIWAIGYEVCAVLILVGIFLAWLKHINSRWKREQARKIPPKDRYGF